MHADSLSGHHPSLAPVSLLQRSSLYSEDALVTLAGGILYIISGSATVNFYKYNNILILNYILN